jgi:hypothetical protein
MKPTSKKLTSNRHPGDLLSGQYPNPVGTEMKLVHSASNELLFVIEQREAGGIS